MEEVPAVGYRTNRKISHGIFSKQAEDTMSNALVSGQLEQLIFFKNIANHSISFALVQTTFRTVCNYPSRILLRDIT
jgi:hypothetical protein